MALVEISNFPGTPKLRCRVQTAPFFMTGWRPMTLPFTVIC